MRMNAKLRLSLLLALIVPMLAACGGANRKCSNGGNRTAHRCGGASANRRGCARGSRPLLLPRRLLRAAGRCCDDDNGQSDAARAGSQHDGGQHHHRRQLDRLPADPAHGREVQGRGLHRQHHGRQHRHRRRLRALLQGRRDRHRQRQPRDQEGRDRELRQASRPRTPIEFRVGTDALAVVVSSDNNFADNLTKAQLAEIFSGKAATWDAVNPAWPKEKIQLFSPGTDSGTFDYFVEVIMTRLRQGSDADKDKGKQAILKAAGIQLSENDNVLVQGVEGSPYAIGYFGYAYFEENAGKLKALNDRGRDAERRDRRETASTRWRARCSSTRTPAS